MQPVRAFPLLAVVLMLTSGLPLDAAEAQPLPPACTVPSGTPIQLALDRARPGEVVTVCPGIYAEALVVRVDGLTLLARGAVTLDGTALVGPRHGVTLAAGLRGFTLDGFEVRNYDDPLVGEADPSSGLVAFHGATGVRILRSSFHDNAWAGVFAVGAASSGWKVEGSTFEDHGFADVHLHGLRDVDVRGGRFDAGLVLSEVAGMRVADGTFRGGGRGAIVVTPGVRSDEVSRQITIQRNAISGHYRHGVWMLSPGHAVVTDNAIDVTGVGLTLGGDRTGVTLARNTASFAYETHATGALEGAFKKGRPPHAQAHVQAGGVTVLGCAGLLCGLSSLADWLLPSARAQAAPPLDSLCAGSPACDLANLSALLSYAVGTGLNPARDPGVLDDQAALQSCAGQPDACLRAAFFADDGLSPLAWSMPVPATGPTPAGTLVFLDAGLRRPGADLATHAATGPLDETWTTLVLCRFVVQGTPRPCDAAPLVFDFGLDVNWSAASHAQHLSRWRLRLPDHVPHDAFDRVHGPDATLFRLDVKPRDASSPPPRDAPVPVQPMPEDPLRVHAAGRAVLVCHVAPTADALVGWDPYRSDCPARALLAEDLDPGVLWCGSPLPDMPVSAHDTLMLEATTGWRWSRTCGPATGGATTDWATLFGPADLQVLADAQNAFYAATTQPQRDAARAAVDALLARLVARHLALDIPGQGMPLQTDPALLDRTLPGFARSLWWDSHYDASAVWIGSHALLFGGVGSEDEDAIRAYHPDRTVWPPPQARLPEHEGPVGSAWTGAHAYVFLLSPSGPETEGFGEILRYDPALDLLIPVQTLLPYDFSGSSAVWDPRDMPAVGCPGGCVYVFGARHHPDGTPAPVLRYNPLLDRLAATKAAVPGGDGSACFDGRHVHLFGTYWTSRTVYRFDAFSETFQAVGEMPRGGVGMPCVWDGSLFYVFGGWSGNVHADVMTFDPATRRSATFPSPLPKSLWAMPAVWTGTEALLIGGISTSPSWHVSFDVLRVPLGFDPVQRLPDLLAASSGHRAVPLLPGDVRVEDLRVLDRDAWAPVASPGLVAFTPVRLNVSFQYAAANGEIVRGAIPVVVRDRAPVLGNVSVAHAGRVLVDVQAVDPDNLDHAAGFRPDAGRRTHTIPVVNATGGAGVLGHSVELPLDARALAACARQAWTARSDGVASNLDGLGRLAVEDDATFLASCRVLDLAPALLRYHAPLVVSLELRQGDAYAATLTVVDDPLRHAARKDDPAGRPTLAQAAAAHAPTAEESSVEPVAGRIVLTLPAGLAPAAKADALAALLAAYADEVGIFAVEVDDLPLTPALARAVEEAVTARGTTLLVGAGTLPEAARALPRQEKLMTITGLAASPHVVTVGALAPGGGVAAWSRRGPTPSLGPKPDLAAPSPEGTTAGAVANLLPFAEALGARGLHDPALARAVLAAYASPVHAEDGALATYWDQGLGSVDLARHLTLPTTAALLEDLRARRGDPDAAATAAHLATTLGTSPAAIHASPPGALLGAAAAPTALLRAAVGATLVNLALDMPALPAQAVVDFGVVSHERQGGAGFTPLDYAPVVAAASNATRILLENAGYSGSQLDDVAAQVAALVRHRALQGNDVTLDATHHYLFDLLTRGDFLHTAYRSLLDAEAAAQPVPPPGASPADTTRLRDALGQWAFDAAHTYRLVDPVSGHARTAVTSQGPPLVAVQGTVQLSRVALEVLRGEARMLEGTSRQADALALDAFTQAHGQRLLAALEPAAYEGEPVAPLPDHAALLGFLADQTRAMRDLRRAPQGPWSGAEATTGAWNGTPLGRQIGNTTVAMGHAPGAVPQGATLVLDALARTLEDALLLLDRDLGDVHAPRLKVGPTTGPDGLLTNVSRTLAAPLGPYVGLATMTSRNVTTYNPLTGEALDRRDVTIPVPSLLWNNPTLVWTESWRDLAPSSSQAVMLYAGDGLIFNKTVVNTTTVEDGVMVYLGADHGSAYQPLVDALQGLDAEIAAEVERDLRESLGPFEDDYKAHLRSLRRSLNDSREDAARAARCEGAECTVDNWASSLAPSLAGLFSHRSGAMGATNASGQIPFRYLFPGAYKLRIPYPFASTVAQDREYDHAVPGLGTLQGSLDDPDHAVARLVRDVLDGLPRHPSAASPRPGDPDAVASRDLTGMRAIEVDGSRSPLFHGFGFNLTGVDLLGVACIDARLFAEATRASLRPPGCAAPALPAPVRESLERVVALGRCALGEPHAALPSEDEAGCASLAAAVREAREDCREDAGRCVRADALANLTRRLDGYVRLLEEDAAAAAGAAAPWVRSPLRLAATRPADFGLTVERLLPRTRALHGLDPADASADATLRPAVESALAGLAELGRARTLTLTQPPRTSAYDHTLSTGVLHHTTDLVSGLDWYHVNPRRSVNQTDAGPLRDLVLDTAGMPVDPADAAALAAYAAGLGAVPDADLLLAFNAGLDATLATMSDAHARGWRANGTVTAAGVDLARGPPEALRIDGAQACAAASALSPLQVPYFPCAPLDAASRPSVAGPANVDRVQLLNALLERVRARSADLAALAPASPEGRALRLSILTDAVRHAGSGAGERWTRAEDGIQVESDGAPLFGAMVYSTPVPINEVFHARLDAELFLENTAAILVVNANPVVTEALLKALAASDLAGLAASVSKDGLDRTANVTRLIDAALHEQGILDPQNEGDPLLRVALLGAPVVETPGAPGSNETRYRGLVATTPGGAHNLSATFTFGTRLRGADGFGPAFMDVILIYFPSVAYPDPATVKQSFLVKNLTIGLETYIGLGTTPVEWGVTHRIGYRLNVEDWKLMHAVSRQKHVGTTGDPAQEGLRVEVATPYATHAPRRANLMLPGPLAVDAAVSCPDSAAPGFRDGDPFGPTAMPFEPGDQTAARATACLRNAPDGGRPVHVEGAEARNDTAMTQPRKRFLDALQYTLNVGEFEDFTEARPAERCSPSSCGERPGVLEARGGGTTPSAGDGGAAAPASAETARVRAELNGGFLLAPPEDPRDPAARVIDLRGARPFVEPSLRWAPALEAGDGPYAPFTVLHNFFHLDETEARTLLPGAHAWDPLVELSFADEAAPALWRNTEDNATDRAHGHVRTDLEPTGYRGGVLAYEVDRPADDATPARAQVSLLAGNGASGAGFALRVQLEHPVVRDGRLQVDASTTARVDAYRLGGERTAGSDCALVPLHDYVKPYFRCTGYSAILTDTTPDMAQVSALLALAQSAPSRRAAATFDEGSAEWWALRALDAPAPTRVRMDVPAAVGAARQGEALATRVLTQAALLVKVHDPPSSPAFPPNALALAAQGLAASLNATVTTGAPASVLPPLRDVTARLQPDLAARGEPPRLVVPTLGILRDGQAVLPQPRSPGYLRVEGPITVTYAVAEWSTRLATATLVETLTQPGGASQTRTLATFGRDAPAGAVTPWVPLEGATHALRLSATDEFGNVVVDELSYVVDNTPPLVVPSPSNPAYSGPLQPEVPVSFEVREPAGRLRGVHLERYAGGGAWVPLGDPLSDAQLAEGVAWLNATVDVTGATTHGASVGVRAVALDHAGNVALSEHHVVRDLEGPDLSGVFVEAFNRTHRTPQGNVSYAAWDNMSGLASWTAWLEDATTGALLPLASATPLSGPDASAVHAWSGLLNRTYRLVVDATDAGGNPSNLTLAEVTVIAAPNMTALIPRARIQQSDHRLHFVADVAFADFPGETVDGFSVRLTAKPATKGVPPVFLHTVRDVRGTVDVWWNASEAQAPPGAYTLQFTAWKGYWQRTSRMDLNLSALLGDHYALEGSAANALGTLPTPGDSTLYRFTHPACAGTMTVTARSMDDAYGSLPHDVDLYVGDGLLGRDASAYSRAADGSAAEETVTLGTAAGATYSILVKHKGIRAADTNFELRLRTCVPDSGGGGESGYAAFDQPPQTDISVDA